jgi:hypothetical protein
MSQTKRETMTTVYGFRPTIIGCLPEGASTPSVHLCNFYSSITTLIPPVKVLSGTHAPKDLHSQSAKAQNPSTYCHSVADPETLVSLLAQGAPGTAE